MHLFDPQHLKAKRTQGFDLCWFRPLNRSFRCSDITAPSESLQRAFFTFDGNSLNFVASVSPGGELKMPVPLKQYCLWKASVFCVVSLG